MLGDFCLFLKGLDQCWGFSKGPLFLYLNLELVQLVPQASNTNPPTGGWQVEVGSSTWLLSPQPPIFVSPVTIKWSSGWSCSFLSEGRGCGDESFLNLVCLHTLQALSTETHRPSLSACLPVCLSLHRDDDDDVVKQKPLGRITQVRRSRKPSLQRGCVEEAFMWLLSLGLQRPAQFGVASLNFSTMRFYSVVVRV